MTVADTFREIDVQAADVRRKLDDQGYTRSVRGDLFGIQRLAQNGLREANENQAKLAALLESRNDLRVALKLCIPWLGRLIADGGHERCAGPGVAVAVLEQAEAAIAKKPNTGEPT